MNTNHLPVWTVIEKDGAQGVIMEVHNADDPHERTWYSVAVLVRGRILGRCWYADDVAEMREAMRRRQDRGRAQRLPVLTVTEGDANNPIVLTGDRANQCRAAELMHQDVRLVPLKGGS